MKNLPRSFSGFALLPIACLVWQTVSFAGSICMNSSEKSNIEVNFCVVISTYHNTSTNSGDVHMIFTHDRYENSALGWTAFGPGNLMAGSLMFIVYGDPQGVAPPTLSIRTTNGHTQPVEVVRQSGLDIRSHTGWVPVSGGHKRATLNIICYGCTSWTGTEISVQNKMFSCVWAFNPTQDFHDSYSKDAELAMHGRDPSSFGIIPVKLDKLETGDRTVPESNIYGGVAGGSGNFALDRRIWKLHGLLTTSAFLAFFPLGLLAIRSHTSISYTMHWVLQSIAGAMAICGIIPALILSGKLSVAHQYLGFFLGLAIITQILLGFRHHVVFLRIRKSTWLSKTHVWLGRCLMVGGSVNVLLGIQLGGYHKSALAVTAGFEIVEALIICFNWWRWSRGNYVGMERKWHRAGMKELDISPDGSANTNSFILAEDEEDEEDKEDDERGLQK